MLVIDCLLCVPTSYDPSVWVARSIGDGTAPRRSGPKGDVKRARKKGRNAGGQLRLTLSLSRHCRAHTHVLQSAGFCLLRFGVWCCFYGSRRGQRPVFWLGVSAWLVLPLLLLHDDRYARRTPSFTRSAGSVPWSIMGPSRSAPEASGGGG